MDTPDVVKNHGGPSNPFTDRGLVTAYEGWYEADGRRAVRLEKRLLQDLLRRFPEVCKILEVGCGTGHFTRWMASQSYRSVGADISPAMLTEARRLGTGCYVETDAGSLPFGSASFDLVAMISALEFIENPVLAVREACRVARRGLILGCINRHSRLGRRLGAKGGPIWGSARLFTAGDMIRIVRQALQGQPGKVFWRTTLWPVWPWGRSPLPWGGFIGMAVELSPERPRFGWGAFARPGEGLLQVPRGLAAVPEARGEGVGDEGEQDAGVDIG